MYTRAAVEINIPALSFTHIASKHRFCCSPSFPLSTSPTLFFPPYVVPRVNPWKLLASLIGRFFPAHPTRLPPIGWKLNYYIFIYLLLLLYIYFFFLFCSRLTSPESLGARLSIDNFDDSIHLLRTSVLRGEDQGREEEMENWVQERSWVSTFKRK